MRILQIDTMSGCGTHLLTNLVRTAGYERLDPNSLKLLQAFVEWERDRASRSTVVGYVGQKSETALVEIFRIMSDDPLAEIPDRAAVLSKFVDTLPKKKLAILNYDNLTCSRDVPSQDGAVLHWDANDVRQLRKMVADGIAASKREIAISNFVRHPIDVYLSKEERGGGDEKFPDRILDFFEIVGSEKTASVGYEELCVSKNPSSLLRALGFSNSDINSLDFSVMHRGEIHKWRRYPRKKIETLSATLETAMLAFGYNCDLPNYRTRLTDIWHKIKAEISVINRMSEGDFRASGAYNWHKRSVPGRIWLRLTLLNRRKRENIAGWHISIGQEPPFRT